MDEDNKYGFVDEKVPWFLWVIWVVLCVGALAGLVAIMSGAETGASGQIVVIVTIWIPIAALLFGAVAGAWRTFEKVWKASRR